MVINIVELLSGVSNQSRGVERLALLCVLPGLLLSLRLGFRRVRLGLSLVHLGLVLVGLGFALSFGLLALSFRSFSISLVLLLVLFGCILGSVTSLGYLFSFLGALRLGICGIDSLDL